MEYKFIDVSMEQSVTQIEKNTQENIKTIKLLSDEVKRLKSASVLKEETNNNVPDIITESDEEEELDEDYSLLEEIKYYYSKIINEKDKLSNLTDNKILKELLPSTKNSNYQNIIYGINTLILKEINEILGFINLDGLELTKEELQEFKDEILFKQKLIQHINSNNIDKQDEESVVEVLNNIVFLETSSGNIYAKEDLNPNIIPSEYYAGFYELIKSIEEGTFKNVKKLTSNNNRTAGISEVKSFKRRVIFDRIDYNIYVILGIFTKKSDKDKGYIDALKRRISIYRNNKESIVERIKDANYISEQKEILDEIYEITKPKNEDKHQDEEKTFQKGLK